MYAIGFPRLYLQGYGIINQLGKEVERFGTSALIVADEFVLNTFSEVIFDSFKDTQVKYNTLLFKGECSPSQIDFMSEEAEKLNCDVLIGIGGGKTLDLIKGIALTINLPLVIVPTIASNDAPTSRVIVTYTDKGEFIGPRFLKLNPECILVDSQIITNAPPRFFACGIADALATYYEAQQCLKKGANNFYNGQQTIIAKSIAKTCNDTIWENAVQAYEDVKQKKCTEAVEKVIEANILLSGVGFEGCGVAAAHAVGLSLSILEAQYGDAKGIMHGEEVALGIIAQFVLEGRSEKEIDELHELYLKLDLPIHFSQVGISDFSDEKKAQVAKAACKPTSRIWNMAVEISEESVIQALNIVEKLGSRKLGLK